jgi:hypothetical protein
MKRLAYVLVFAGAGLVLGIGCGGQKAASVSAEEVANAKVEAIKRLADAMAKSPDGVEARGALEDYRVTSFDARSNPKQAEEILNIYRQRIQGKYRGEVAQEVQTEMASLQAALKSK